MLKRLDENGNREKRLRVRRIRRFTIRSIAPNVMTILALAAGMTAIRFALDERWEAAIVAVVVAGVFDGLDGTVARLLKGTSRFGAELDSLSDAISFGVAPAIILYLWGLDSLGGLGWGIALGFAVCCTLRLARFNSALDDDEHPLKRAGYMTGVPAPAAAGLSLMPVMIFFAQGWQAAVPPIGIAVWTGFVALLMVSRVPTFSFKALVVGRNELVPLLVTVALFAGLVSVYTWWSLLAIGFAYLASMPMSWMRARRRLARRASKQQRRG